MDTIQRASAPSSASKHSADTLALRTDLALALRAAAHHGLHESVCNHFSVALPDGSDRFLINPRGLHWSEVDADDIVMVDAQGKRLAGKHEVETTAMFIHGAIHRIAGKACVLHTHMPYATALCLTRKRSLDTTLSQNAMRFHGRVAVDGRYNGLALDNAEGERIARAMNGADIAFLGNHGVVVCGERVDYAYDDLYFLERACQAEVLALSTGLPLEPADADVAAVVAGQVQGERLQSTLFFESLRRLVPPPARRAAR
jgi:ribulose-5-phosphate 4-epimerase/fuculose-1-phosphate aldolase